MLKRRTGVFASKHERERREFRHSLYSSVYLPLVRWTYHRLEKTWLWNHIDLFSPPYSDTCWKCNVLLSVKKGWFNSGYKQLQNISSLKDQSLFLFYAAYPTWVNWNSTCHGPTHILSDWWSFQFTIYFHLVEKKGTYKYRNIKLTLRKQIDQYELKALRHSEERQPGPPFLEPMWIF